MTIEKININELNNTAGGYDAEKGKGYVFFCLNCGDYWTEWSDKEENFKGKVYECPNCKQKKGKFVHQAKSLK